MAFLHAGQVDDAVRAVAAKNNRPDSQLTGTRPLKMRYKPDKVHACTTAACRPWLQPGTQCTRSCVHVGSAARQTRSAAQSMWGRGGGGGWRGEGPHLIALPSHVACAGLIHRLILWNF